MSIIRKTLILDAVNDMVADFLYYDRKEDEDLTHGEIEKALEEGDITIEEIVARFAERLKVGIA